MIQNYEELLEQVRGLGAYRAELIDVEKIRFDRAFRGLCEQNACGNYGQCWMCPPDAGGYRRADCRGGIVPPGAGVPDRGKAGRQL